MLYWQLVKNLTAHHDGVMSEKRHRIKPVHTDRARRLRRVMTGPERHLWSVLRDKQIGGLRFRRQHPVGRFIADFACLEAHLIVEVDGESHVGQFDADNARTRELMRQGFKVLRFTNDEVLQATEAVANTIARAAGLDW